MNELQRLLEPTPLPPTDRAKRVSSGDPLYHEILDFLHDEAELLDTLQLRQWGESLTRDLEYNLPIRLTRPVRQQAQTVVRTVQHMHDNYGSMMVRIMRITDTKSAWGEDPPSRTKRLVSNVRVFHTDKANEYKVLSYLLVTRSRFDFDDFDLIPCERHDILRREDGQLKLARREIIVDQAVIGTPNLGIFF
ncbi:aromatic-ring-hydroxylating dioxygenase subunit beta [Pseudomonas borbori]|uniref:3-phenylpropionate/cinnamic acid dioxygenase, small subunit n=1 Tax=Pseudomonas borbori TaxID=289003 RepID=A0A1I5UG94_9PSED|nr:3-phenylpropionate/cinnamic acid dioxygenase subunit beta [Pseudomonas borbori]OHC35513.1 MAG: aromatic-ring-hydroxylating dioxygenase subunit beta [Pseudomonadales bacterium RIFCSPLOWO2_02_FULL_63_210]SFP94219.1 3-phenylpropionate/cinnamic acid dioxygenase, small subunit [Pseudomonas borbori]